MAKGNGIADAPTEGATTESTTTEGATPAAKKVRPDRSYIVVPVPAELKQRFEDEAKAKDQPVGPYVRNLLAGFLGIEIPTIATARRSKYGSDEERKAAQKVRNQNRSGTMRDLMKAFRDAQASGKTPEEAAQIASAAMVKLMTEGPSQPAPKATADAPAEAEAVPA